MAGLTLNYNYLNPYESAYNVVKHNPLYDNDSWKYATDKGELDEYIFALNKTRNIDLAKFYNDYKLDFATSETKLAALYNEAFADREAKNRQIVTYDDKGNEIVTDVEMSDYDYYKDVLHMKNSALEVEYKNELIRQAKESRSWFEKAVTFIFNIPLSLMKGVTSGVNDIVEFLGSFVDGTIDSIATGKSWAECVGDSMASGEFRPLQFIENAIVDYEMESGWRDPVTGEYTNAGKILGGTFETIGKFVPSAVLAYFTGGSSLALKSAISMGTFYLSSEFGQSYKQHYMYAKANNLDVNYLAMMGADFGIACTKMLISLGMNKVFGATALQSKVFNLPGKTGLGAQTGFAVRTLIHAGKDFLQEGTEEVIQDLVEVLAHDMMGGDYAELSNLNPQDLLITFLVAGLASVVSTSKNILTTDKLTVKQDGKIVKLNKIQSYAVNVDISNTLQNFHTITDLSKKHKGDYTYDTSTIKGKRQATKIENAFRQSYNSMRVIGSLFGEIGEERTRVVLNALNRISYAAKIGKFNHDYIFNTTSNLSKLILGKEGEMSDIQTAMLQKDLEEAAITNIIEVSDSADDKEKVQLSEENKSKLDNIIKKDKNLKNVLVAKDGKDAVVTDSGKTAVIPETMLNTYSDNEVLKTLAGKKLIKSIRNNKKFNRHISMLKDLYKTYKSVDEISDSNLISALFYDSDFYKAALFNSNFEAYEILSHLISMAKASKTGDVSDAIYNEKLSEVIKPMQEALVFYLIHQQEANYMLPSDVLTDEQIKRIKKERYLDVIKIHSEQGKLTKTDISFITDKVNGLSLNEKRKKVILDDITSNNLPQVRRAWKAIAEGYRKIFTKGYDGRTYMPLTNVVNFTYNSWLQSNGLTIDTLLSIGTSDTENILKYYGEVNDENILKYRQTQFNTYTSQRYNFEYDNGIVKIFGNDGKQIGFTFHKNIVILNKELDIKDKNVGILSTENAELISKYCNHRLSEISKASLTLNDIIFNNDYLSETVLKNVKNMYNDTTPYSVYLYMHDRILYDTDNKYGITILADNTYAFTDVKSMMQLYKSDKVAKEKLEKLRKDGYIDINELIDDKYILPFEEGSSNRIITFKNLSNGVRGSAEVGKPIYLNKNYNFTDNELLYVIAHEYIHKMQDYNNMNFGFNNEWLKNLAISDRKTAHAIVDDVYKHVPDIFNVRNNKGEIVNKKESLLSNLKEQENVLKKLGKKVPKYDKYAGLYDLVSDFIYYGCGELNAFGMENNITLSYYPVVVGKDYISMPWGTTYNYDTGKIMNFTTREDNGKIVINQTGKYLSSKEIYDNVTKYDSFIQLFEENEDYKEALELYNYLKSKSKYLSGPDLYKNMYISDHDGWLDLYDKQFEKFMSMKCEPAVTAYKSIRMNNTFSLETDKQIKNNLVASLNPDDRITMLEMLRVQIAPDVSFEDFLEMEIPFVRVQQNEDLYDTDFVSVSVGSFGTASFASVLYNDLIQRDLSYAYIGTLKVNQLMGYIDPSTFEAIVKPSVLLDSEQYLVDIQEDGIYVHDNFTNTTETIRGLERVSYFKDDSVPMDMDRPPKFRNTDEWEEINESEIAYDKKPDSKYTSRRIFKNTRTGKIRISYSYKGLYKNQNVNRQISKKKAKYSNNLQKYKGQQLAPDFQSFVINATPSIGHGYYDKIQKGNLKRSEVLDDFRSGRIKDNETFNLINKSFFKNPNIESVEKLDSLLANNTEMWAAVKLLKATNMDIDAIESMSVDVLYEIINFFESDPTLKKAYLKLLLRYYISPDKEHRGKQLDISQSYLRMLYMERYDGSLESARKCASLARSIATAEYITTESKTSGMSKGGGVSLEQKTLDEHERGEFLGYDVDFDADADDLVSAPRDDKLQAISMAKLIQLQESGRNSQKDLDLYKEWKKKLYKQSDEKVDSLYIKYVIQHITGKNKNYEVYASLVYEQKDKLKNVVRGIRGHINTIKRNLKSKDLKRFLSDNSDIFNEDLTLKEDVIHDKDKAGRLIYKDSSIIQSVKDRLYKLSKDVQGQKYSSQNALNLARKLEKDVAKYKRQLSKKLKEGSKPGKYETVTFVQQDRSLTIDVSKKVPKALVPLLNYALDKTADTNIQYLSEDNEKHIQVSLKNFVEDNETYLLNLTQNEIDDIVDFYLTSEIIPSTNDAAKYTGIQIMTLSYILKGAQDGIYVMDSSVINAIDSRLKTIVSNAGTQLDTWKTAMKMFKPAEQLVANFYTQFGVDVTTQQLSAIQRAYSTGDFEYLTKVRSDIYNDIVEKNSKQYKKEAEKRLKEEQVALDKLLSKNNLTTDEALQKEKLQKSIQEGFVITKGKSNTGTEVTTTSRNVKKRVDSFFSKVWNMERAFMLSSPGTGIRNQVSNAMIGGLYVKDKQILPGLNDSAGKIGNFVMKLLPKKWKKERVEQWKIVGTQVSNDAKNFIKTNFIDNNLINMIGDAVSKYDARGLSRKTFKHSELFAELITRKLAQDAFNNNHKIASLFGKMLSDDKSIQRAAIKYYGKILTESGIKLSEETINKETGKNQITPIAINDKTTELFVEAYLLAADDFMHKSNFVHKFEQLILDKLGNVAYVAYKQFFPFASSSLNWFAESLKYTPFGLIKSVINFAKLESQIAKMDDLRAKGERTPSSKFAQYIAIRNIGKGVIGSIGTLIGIILASLGLVSLDEDDDKYKLRVGKVSVDITDLFSTQGILLGMGIAQGARDNKSFITIVKESFNTLYDDSIYNSVLNMFKGYGNESLADSFENYLTYNIPNMFVPNILTTFAGVARKYDVQFSGGFVGKLERLVVNSIPFIDRAFPHQYDIYTGEKSYRSNFSEYFITLLNKLSPVKMKQHDITATEELAITLGINKKSLSGRYTINEEKVNLKPNQLDATNKLYGSLNKKDLADFTSGKKSYKVQKEDGTYVTLKYNQMTDKQKAAVINRIMENNSGIAKIYALTNLGYKYYANDSEYSTLKKLGIKNVYKKTGKYEGFVKIN